MNKCYLCTILLFAFFLCTNAQDNEIKFLTPVYRMYRDSNPNILILARHGKILNPNDYTIKVDGGSYTMTDSSINVYSKFINNVTVLDKKGKTIGYWQFGPMPEPHFACWLNGLASGGNVNKASLSIMNVIIPIAEGWNRNIKEVIKEYWGKMTIGNETRTFYYTGPMIDDTLKKMLLSAKAFSRLEFNMIGMRSNVGVINFEKDPLSFNINTYERYVRDYLMLLSDSERTAIDTSGFYTDLYQHSSQILITNCNFSDDTCSTSLYFTDDGYKALALRYSYLGGDSERVQLFHQNKMISDICYKHDVLYEHCSVCYINGRIKEEGNYKLSDIKNDSIRSYNPYTMIYERIPYQYQLPERTGIWRSYSETGKIEEKRY